ncbi:hypothetical protein [Nocardia sp. NPDC051570]|uniref:hypothetical protein n=1 Tax=Nocardia sp. NPDC051570 TaxID=3364324 RepID=UPI00378F90C6
MIELTQFALDCPRGMPTSAGTECGDARNHSLDPVGSYDVDQVGSITECAIGIC